MSADHDRLRWRMQLLLAIALSAAVLGLYLRFGAVRFSTPAGGGLVNEARVDALIDTSLMLMGLSGLTLVAVAQRWLQR